MKRNSPANATMKKNSPARAETHANGRASAASSELCSLLSCLQAMRDGDFSVRLPSDWTGLEGKIADTFNTIIAANQTIAQELKRVGQVVGKEGKTRERTRFDLSKGVWGEMEALANTLVDDLLRPITEVTRAIAAVAQGNLTQTVRLDVDGRPLEGEFLQSAAIVNTMIDNLRLTTERNAAQDWLKTNLVRVIGMLQGQRDLATVGRMLLSELTPLVNAQRGVIYQMKTEESPGLKLLSTFADDGQNRHRQYLQIGEGLIGQCAVEKRCMLITDLPSHTVPIRSGLFQAVPQNVIVLPVLFEDQVKAVIELASLSTFTASHLVFLEQLAASIGIVFNRIEATAQTEGLLHQSQQLAAELQRQQKELQQTNERLAHKAQQLAKQNLKMERKNQEIEQARRALEAQAAELALTSRYKSEFLANMSHELRTPLNSILVLSQQLGDNPDGNLPPRQVRFARTIHAAGTDLLHLISDILDLSKIESGTVTVEAEEIVFTTLLDTVARPFRHEAEHRQLIFDVHTDPHLGRSLVTDSKRLQQVLKNLLSNAFKFTEQGGVRLRISAAAGGWSTDHPILKGAPAVVAFEVADTGIGIPFEKQRIIFEAFQQADAGTSRKYGGTGLGLAISRELANLLGGEIQVRSIPGMGSMFTLYLPQTYVGPSASNVVMTDSTAAPTPPLGAFLAVRVLAHPVESIPDDRDTLQPDDAVLLIVEDDPHYARILCDLSRDTGFKVIVAMRGAEALDLARQYHPTAISLDVFLPDMLGWTVLSHLKQDSATRHIPVQMVTLDEDQQHGLARGAFAFVTKPTTTESLEVALSRIRKYATPHRKRLLVVEDNAAKQLRITELLGHNDIDIAVANTGEQALAVLHEQPFDCVVLDLRLPDMSGFEVLECVRDNAVLGDVPVVVFTDKELSPEEDARLHTLARSMVVKGVESPERLLDETALFLHRVVADLPPEKQQMLDRLHCSDDDLVGKKVLVVDDDVRNIFALSSVLERRGMTVLTAGTGREAIATLDSAPSLAIVLMDMMMPEMDGYETMQVIRQHSLFRRLPIIALTAKAMQGDREKCLEAGASDYLAKPVNTEQLLSTLRMWLHR